MILVILHCQQADYLDRDYLELMPKYWQPGNRSTLFSYLFIQVWMLMEKVHSLKPDLILPAIQIRPRFWVLVLILLMAGLVLLLTSTVILDIRSITIHW